MERGWGRSVQTKGAGGGHLGTGRAAPWGAWPSGVGSIPRVIPSHWRVISGSDMLRCAF